MVVDEASPMLADVMWLQMVFAQNGQDPERCPINAMLKTQRKKLPQQLCRSSIARTP
jgi:hypothetical protein